MTFKQLTDEYLNILKESNLEPNEDAKHRNWTYLNLESLRYTYKNNPELQKEYNLLISQAMNNIGFSRSFKPAKNELIMCNRCDEKGCKNGFFCNFAHSDEELQCWKSIDPGLILNATEKFMNYKPKVDIRNLTGVKKEKGVGFFLSKSIREHFFDGKSALQILRQDKRFKITGTNPGFKVSLNTFDDLDDDCAGDCSGDEAGICGAADSKLDDSSVFEMIASLCNNSSLTSDQKKILIKDLLRKF
jgi:hypothetical protein